MESLLIRTPSEAGITEQVNENEGFIQALMVENRRASLDIYSQRCLEQMGVSVAHRAGGSGGFSRPLVLGFDFLAVTGFCSGLCCRASLLG